MAEEIEQTIQEEPAITELPVEEPSQEVDYKALAEAEKERADAAEALIVKNKALNKRDEKKEEATLTEERVLELIKTAVKQDDTSDEAKTLATAQAKVKEITAKNTELARALKSKGTVSTDIASTQHDGLPSTAPKLAPNSPLKEYKHEGNGLYSKKLGSGKTLYRNTKAGPGESKTWVA